MISKNFLERFTKCSRTLQKYRTLIILLVRISVGGTAGTRILQLTTYSWFVAHPCVSSSATIIVSLLPRELFALVWYVICFKKLNCNKKIIGQSVFSKSLGDAYSYQLYAAIRNRLAAFVVDRNLQIDCLSRYITAHRSSRHNFQWRRSKAAPVKWSVLLCDNRFLQIVGKRYD